MSRARKRLGGNPARGVTGTGVRYDASRRHHTRIPQPGPGEHVWTVIGMWRVADPTADQFHLDLENLLTIEGPGCFACEQPYTPELAATPCPGDPEGKPL